MEGNTILLLPVLLPVLAGLLMLTGKWFRPERGVPRSGRIGLFLTVLAAEFLAVLFCVSEGGELHIWQLTAQITLTLRVDGVSRLFSVLTSGVWLCVGVYAVSYMAHEREEHRFFGFYLMVEGILAGLDFSANLITLYVFYELMTLCSLPLVLHERTREAVMAGLKYLFYSVGGAFLALFGVIYLHTLTGGSLDFAAGGSLQAALGENALFLAAVFCMLLGFGVKAGSFPFHGWLPAAHPVAPAPASAVLSGVIAKSGVLAVLRVVYFVVGPERIRGTWVQDVWIGLSLATVFMGSMLAYKEPVLKKRLAYSTVSQISYILFGLSVLEPTALVGALSHVIFHSLIKNGLFLMAGAVIVTTGWTRVEQLRGLGRVMPATLGCYVFLSLALVGIPPASGFVSKWYLAVGALASGTGMWSILGPIVLLLSALLTAGYLFPVFIAGFFPGQGFDEEALAAKGLLGKEPSLWMTVPLAVLTAGAFLLGCFPSRLLAFLSEIAGSVLL